MSKSTPLTEAGFSLIELSITMTVTLVAMALASTLVGESFKTRAREDRRAEALADVQRALNMMTREIANSGFGMVDNGIYVNATDVNASDSDSIRTRADFDRYTTSTPDGATDPDEDILYMLAASNNQTSLFRRNGYPTEQWTVLATNISNLRFRYFNQKVEYTSTSNCNGDITLPVGVTEVAAADRNKAGFVVISVCAQLPAVGAPGSPGYQPPSQVQLVSDVVLRNANPFAY